jgi:hypothetical protein
VVDRSGSGGLACSPWASCRIAAGQHLPFEVSHWLLRSVAGGPTATGVTDSIRRGQRTSEPLTLQALATTISWTVNLGSVKIWRIDDPRIAE